MKEEENKELVENILLGNKLHALIIKILKGDMKNDK